MRISLIQALIDYDRLAQDYQVFKLRKSGGKLGYADEVLDILASKAVVVAVAFLGDGEAWVMTRRQRDASEAVRAALQGRSDVAIREERSLRRVGDRALLQLSLCAIAGSGGMEHASNLCGKLIVVNLGKPHTEYIRGTANPGVIHALEVNVSPRMELELKVRTFTSCALRQFKSYKPRFRLADGRYLKRAHAYTDENDQSLFCQGVRFENDRYGRYAFMDASNADSFSRSKLGVLRDVLVCLDYLFEGAVRIGFEEAQDISRIAHQAQDKTKRRVPIAKRFEGETIRVCDAAGDLGTQAEHVASTINTTFGIHAEVTGDEAPGGAVIRLVHEKEFYKDGLGDLYHVSDERMIVQHLTPSSGFSETAIVVAVKELALKLDISCGRIGLFDWKWGRWEFALRSGDGEGDTLAFLRVDEDGSMVFDGPLPAIEAFADHGALADAMALNESCELAVCGPEGDVNVVTRTELFGVPNFETVWHDLIERREDRRVGRNGKPIKAAIGRGAKDIDLYFADAVDIASCESDDGRRYYRVGMRGRGMQYSATHKASILREVIAMDGSRSLVEDLLPMLDVEIIRWGQPTVLPFPVKYLREWVSMGEED